MSILSKKMKSFDEEQITKTEAFIWLGNLNLMIFGFLRV